MTERILITGGTGFAGSHLVEWLLTLGSYDVHVTTASSKVSYVNSLLPKEQIHQVDLTNFQQTEELIKKTKPDAIYHLAAIAVVGSSFEQAREIIQNNLSLQLNILDAVRAHTPQARLLIVGSAMEYDVLAQAARRPIDEDYPLGPANPYGVSKVAQDLLGLSYCYSYKLDIVRARPFNHIGERQTTEFAVPSFTEQIIAIEKGLQPPQLAVGNLDAVRDFTDVKDVVKAYHTLMKKGQTGKVYNVGSGKGTSMRTILEHLLTLSEAKVNVVTDTQKHRPLDVPMVIADTTRINKLGWSPTIPLTDTLQRIVTYWRKQT